MTAQPSSNINGAIRVCCHIDRVAGKIVTSLRCRTKHELPEDGLLLSDGTVQAECGEASFGWSSPLRSVPNGEILDACRLDWSRGSVFKDQDRKWKLAFRGADVRVLASGTEEGLMGYVEWHQLPSGTPFFLATAPRAVELIRRWGAGGCAGFEEVEVRMGLPGGWRLFRIERVIDDQIVRNSYPALNVPSAVRLRLDGGVRISRGNDFFAFALPRVVVEGYVEGMTLYCNGRAVERSATNGQIFELGEFKGGKASLELRRRDNETLARRTFYGVSDFAWPIETEEVWIDGFGRRVDDSGNCRASGPRVIGIDLEIPIWMPAGLHGERRVFFIGRAPGEIVSWPAEQFPESWSPVWAVPMRRNGYAVFCGSSATEAEPLSKAVADRKRVELWKQVLWRDRKRIAGPKRKTLQVLWNRFQEAARNV